MGLFQIGFLDLATGAFVAHVLSKVFYGESSSLLFLALGAAISVLPDIDLVSSVMKREAPDLTHRNTIFHSPLVLLLFPTLLFSLYSPFSAFFWALPILLHYLHDTLDDSGGIAWLSPFSQTKFGISLFGKKFLTRRSPHDPGLTLDQTLTKKYYRLTPTTIIEAVLPIILLTIIFLTW